MLENSISHAMLWQDGKHHTDDLKKPPKSPKSPRSAHCDAYTRILHQVNMLKY
jgi:hypothetical protein